MTSSHQIENICKEIENIKMRQMEILEMKSMIIKVKNSLKDRSHVDRHFLKLCCTRLLWGKLKAKEAAKNDGNHSPQLHNCITRFTVWVSIDDLFSITSIKLNYYVSVWVCVCVLCVCGSETDWKLQIIGLRL